MQYYETAMGERPLSLGQREGYINMAVIKKKLTVYVEISIVQ